MDEALNQLPDDDSLDRLLGEARWPEPEAGRLDRLRHGYLRERWWIGFNRITRIAVAAVLVITVGAWWVMPVPRHERITMKLPTPSPVHKRVAEATIESRPATLLERAILYSAQARTNQVKMQAEETAIRTAIAQVESSKSSPPAAARTLGPDSEQMLADVIQTTRGARRLAAVRLLSEVATAKSAPLLVKLANDPRTCQAALPGVLRLGDFQSLADLARQTHSHVIRQKLLSALLHREANEAVPLYLAFVEEPATATDALAAADDAPQPAIDELFARLDDPHLDVRLAAARALGRIDGPAVTRRLAAMVERNVNQREALAALITSHGRDAQAIVAQARRRSSLAATIQSLEILLQSNSKGERL